MSLINLSIATNDYDHFRDVRIRKLNPEGIDLNWFIFTHHECFARFTAGREFDISELSFAKFSTQITRDKPDIIGLPIVCSRLFRFSSCYVNKNSGVKTVEDLKGKRVGSPVTFTMCSSSRKTKVSQGYLIRRYRGTHYHGLRPMPEICGTS